MTTLRIALVQTNPIVGDTTHNANLVINAIRQASSLKADIILTPEMIVPGYPAEDLLGEASFLTDVERTTRMIAIHAPDDAVLVLGTALRDHCLPSLPKTAGGMGLDAAKRNVHNVVALAHDGRIHATVSKTLLPEYSVFDDARWVAPGEVGQLIATISGVKVGFAICEDVWTDDVADAAAAQGAQILLVSNASPYCVGKPAERVTLVSRLARRTGMTVVYVNSAVGQDELVFDGGSFVVTPSGEILLRAPLFTPGLFYIDVTVPTATHQPATSACDESFTFTTVAALNQERPTIDTPLATWPDEDEEIFTALVTGLRDYVLHNHFQKVLLGLSGGLDSALAAVIAVDALGARHVRGIGMPGPYSSTGSVDDARALAANLGIRFDVISITDTYNTEVALLGDLLDGPGVAVAKENIQARLRALHLMTLANATNSVLLNTGNRSEAAVGYVTLGGDSNGGYAPLKDIPKTTAYRLAEWRNKAAANRGETPPIPEETITKPPSAELAPDQLDTNTLPPYPILDRILHMYLEEFAGAQDIVDDLVNNGHERDYARDTTLRILGMVDRAEHKRRQVAPGLKVTQRAFGKDRRVPISNGRQHHL